MSRFKTSPSEVCGKCQLFPHDRDPSRHCTMCNPHTYTRAKVRDDSARQWAAMAAIPDYSGLGAAFTEFGWLVAIAASVALSAPTAGAGAADLVQHTWWPSQGLDAAAMKRLWVEAWSTLGVGTATLGIGIGVGLWLKRRRDRFNAGLKRCIEHLGARRLFRSKAIYGWLAANWCEPFYGYGMYTPHADCFSVVATPTGRGALLLIGTHFPTDSVSEASSGSANAAGLLVPARPVLDAAQPARLRRLVAEFSELGFHCAPGVAGWRVLAEDNLLDTATTNPARVVEPFKRALQLVDSLIECTEQNLNDPAVRPSRNTTSGHALEPMTNS